MTKALESMWNSNWSLSQTYKYVSFKKLPITKSMCVDFYKASYKLHGSCGSYSEAKKKSWSYRPSRSGLISNYSAHTGMFGSYAQWLGLSVSYFLKKHGYEPLTKQEQINYRTY